MNRQSLGRYALPVLAVLGLVFAAFVVLRGAPDRSMREPALAAPEPPAPLRRQGTVAGAGIVEPASELIELSPLVPGVVTDVRVAPGATVKAGDVLLRLDDRDARAALAEAEAGLALARRRAEAATVALANARAQLALLDGVREPDAISGQDRLNRAQAVASAEAEQGVARAQVAEAEAGLAAARTELSRRTVTAPIDGEILQVKTRPGQFVTAGPAPSNAAQPAIIMGNVRPLHVRIDIDETEIGRVAIGQPAMVSPRGAADQQVAARFVRAEPLVVPKRSLTNSAAERVDVRVLQLIYALPDAATGFAIGQQVDAFMPARAPGK
jgi:RND family efflux transporter MFP subunit